MYTKHLGSHHTYLSCSELEFVAQYRDRSQNANEDAFIRACTRRTYMFNTCEVKLDNVSSDPKKKRRFFHTDMYTTHLLVQQFVNLESSTSCFHAVRQ